MRCEMLPESVGDQRPIKRITPLRTRLRAFFKRAFDLAAAIALLVIVLPVFSLIVFGLLLTGQSPFCAQVRIGQYGRPFGRLKFKTIHRNADNLPADPPRREWEPNRSLRDDPLATGLDSLLRTTCLDELPQLLNVIVGHMSLIGPAAVTKVELDTVCDPLEAAAYRSVRPGLIGLKQPSGSRQVGYSHRAVPSVDRHPLRE